MILLSDAIKDLSTNQLSVIYTRVVEGVPENNLLIDGQVAKDYFNRLYGNWTVMAIDSADFLNLWNLHNNTESFNLYKMIEAFNSEYDPISNYDSNIREEWIKGKQETTNNYGASTTTNNYGATKTTTTQGATATTQINSETTADNTLDYKNRTKSQINGDSVTNTNQADAREDSTTTNAREDKSTTESYTDVRVFTQKGNIGVTTSQQMIQSSLELYKQNPTLYYLDNFVKRYCYYSEVVE